MDVGDAAARVSATELMRHVRAFARHQKPSGGEGERESLRHVQASLDGWGYRTRLILHDAYISLPGAARVEAGGRELRCITHSFSRPSPPGGLRGPLVDVGEGAAAEFAGRDLRGCVLLVAGIASPAVAARALAAGAAGQLHVSPQHRLHEMCISPVWGSPSAETLAELPATVACTISDADGADLRARLRGGEAIEVVLHASVDAGWRPTPILEAELDAPAGPDAPFVLLSGHHDAWYFGVMDNGTANATMLEAARVLAADRASWRRGLRLCFWSGHSHGRYSGSAWYADQRWEELERRCCAHVNVDSTGGRGATSLEDSAASFELAGLAAEAVRAEAGQAHAGHLPGRNSDQSFWGIGVPSAFGMVSTQVPGTETFGPPAMRNALGWWWHTPEDLIENVDELFLARDTRVVVHALHRLLCDPVLPLDPGAAAAALLRELRAIAPGEDAVPLAATVSAAEALCARAWPRTDLGLMRACRALVPLALTAGDRFAHDPALPLPAWPALAPLRAWAATEPGSDARRFAAVGAVRACNRVLHALREAASA